MGEIKTADYPAMTAALDEASLKSCGVRQVTGYSDGHARYKVDDTVAYGEVWDSGDNILYPKPTGRVWVKKTDPELETFEEHLKDLMRPAIKAMNQIIVQAFIMHKGIYGSTDDDGNIKFELTDEVPFGEIKWKDSND